MILPSLQVRGKFDIEKAKKSGLISKAEILQITKTYGNEWLPVKGDYAFIAEGIDGKFEDIDGLVGLQMDSNGEVLPDIFEFVRKGTEWESDMFVYGYKHVPHYDLINKLKEADYSAYMLKVQEPEDEESLEEASETEYPAECLSAHPIFRKFEITFPSGRSFQASLIKRTNGLRISTAADITKEQWASVDALDDLPHKYTKDFTYFRFSDWLMFVLATHELLKLQLSEEDQSWLASFVTDSDRTYCDPRWKELLS